MIRHGRGHRGDQSRRKKRYLQTSKIDSSVSTVQDPVIGATASASMAVSRLDQSVVDSSPSSKPKWFKPNFLGEEVDQIRDDIILNLALRFHDNLSEIDCSHIAEAIRNYEIHIGDVVYDEKNPAESDGFVSIEADYLSEPIRFFLADIRSGAIHLST